MEGILNLLRKLGYSENEIKNVLNKVPVEPQGIMGTNVATGVFSKPKKGELAKDFLVSDVIGNPFEIDYYKGRSREDILKSAEAQLKMMKKDIELRQKEHKLKTDLEMDEFEKELLETDILEVKVNMNNIQNSVSGAIRKMNFFTNQYKSILKKLGKDDITEEE